MPLEPTEVQLARFVEPGVAEPVTMLNLLRFKDVADGIHADEGISGAEAYARYGAAIQENLRQVGAEIVWVGQCYDALIGPDEREWDAVAVVRYPSRDAFLTMVSDPVYQQRHRHREAALADSRLIPT